MKYVLLTQTCSGVVSEIIIPTNVHVNRIKKINSIIAPTCFGVLTPSSGGLQVVTVKVMNY